MKSRRAKVSIRPSGGVARWRTCRLELDQEKIGGACEGGGGQPGCGVAMRVRPGDGTARGPAAIGKTLATTGIGPATTLKLQSGQCPPCSRSVCSPGARSASLVAITFRPDVVQISSKPAKFTCLRDIASDGAAILNRTANNRAQVIGKRNFLWRNIALLYMPSVQNYQCKRSVQGLEV